MVVSITNNGIIEEFLAYNVMLAKTSVSIVSEMKSIIDVPYKFIESVSSVSGTHLLINTSGSKVEIYPFTHEDLNAISSVITLRCNQYKQTDKPKTPRRKKKDDV